MTLKPARVKDLEDPMLVHCVSPQDLALSIDVPLDVFVEDLDPASVVFDDCEAQGPLSGTEAPRCDAEWKKPTTIWEELTKVLEYGRICPTGNESRDEEVRVRVAAHRSAVVPQPAAR